MSQQKGLLIHTEYHYSVWIRWVVSLCVACVMQYLARPEVKRDTALHKQRGVFCRGRNFATFLLKNLNVAYKFAWGQILNKYAVIFPDKQNNNRKMSRLFVFDS